MKNNTHEKYYVNMKQKLLKDFDKMFKSAGQVLRQYYDDKEIDRLGIGFSRTQTIGNGGEVCDFRFKKGGVTPNAWPPERLKEWKKKNKKR